MLPDKIEKETPFATQYNKLAGNIFFKEKIKPVVNVALGGTWRLFVEKVYQGSYFTRNEETVLTLTATMPNGTTLPQMNDLVTKMERYLSGFSEIRQFQTSIPNARRASINIYFRKEAEQTGFPYQLKSSAISKALELGGGSWSVYGLQDQGFSNDVRESAGQYRVKLTGYNYDELTAWADTLKQQLLTYRRIREVIINSNFSWYKDDYQEFSFELDKQRLAALRIMPGELFYSLQPVFAQDSWSGTVMMEGENENIMLSSKMGQEYDTWALQHVGMQTRGITYKLGDVANIERGQAPQEVGKENQQYRLALQYDYIGSHTQGERTLEKEIKALNERLPMGYSAEKEGSYWGWGQQDNKQYWLTFYWFKLNFDQGGFASFILLAGITINASIYILDEYNRVRKLKPLLSSTQAYLKAWNTKIIPIFLTIVSTILGFIPFMVGTQKESFWFPLAAGTIGGLIMSFIGIFIFLPLLMVRNKN